MIQFNFQKFKLDNRLSSSELAKRVHSPLRSITFMESRKTIKPSFLRRIEKVYGDCTEYIMVEEPSEILEQ